MQTSLTTASVVEAFISIQGEGPKVGELTFFVRSAGCPLRCTYCDTVYSYRSGPSFPLIDFAGNSVAEHSNPIDPERLLAGTPPGFLRGVRWLSFTGGEPLLYPAFGRGLFEAGHARGLRAFLETAASDPAALHEVLPATDHLSMDFKLPSTLHGSCDRRDDHVSCLALALEHGVETAVKIVLTAGVPGTEWRDAVARLAPYRSRFVLVLQPVTPCLDEREPLPGARLRGYAADAAAHGHHVLVLPQVHRHLGLR